MKDDLKSFTPKEAIEALEAAKEYLLSDEHEWCKNGNYHLYQIVDAFYVDGSYDVDEIVTGACLIGAVALGYLNMQAEYAFDPLNQGGTGYKYPSIYDDLIHKFTDGRFDTVPSFNDDETTYFNDVMDFIDFATVELKKEL